MAVGWAVGLLVGFAVDLYSVAGSAVEITVDSFVEIVDFDLVVGLAVETDVDSYWVVGWAVEIAVDLLVEIVGFDLAAEIVGLAAEIVVAENHPAESIPPAN